MSELEKFSSEIDDLLVRIDAREVQFRRGGIDGISAEMDVYNSLIDAREALQKLIAATDKEYVRQQLPVRMCQCVDTDNTLCSIHTVSHPYRDGCCGEPDDEHRHMTEDEYRAAYPKVFDATVHVGDTGYRVDAHRYTGGVGVTLTQLFPRTDEDEDDDDYGGLCFDISLEGLKATLPLLQKVAEL